ncbi:hypothetical protein ACFX13_004378 [Malus domestica]|uniref:SKP1-like protein n=1 Tax=Malus domestica TaxID=3750 RepID=S0BEC9_MALDO|nr:SKP1-like protein 11 [Malus domestica]BAO95640.1 SLF-interacting Skp1-like protein 1 [Malus domestica]CCH26219.1 SLF-interacting Skp1-like protein 1 [Malus domestica]
MSTEEKKIEDPASSASATEENKSEASASASASASEAPSTTENDGAEKKKISLKTSDGEVFEIDGDIAMQFQTVKSFFQDEGVGDMVMPLPNVHSAELVNIIDFCTKTQHLHRKVEHDEAWRKELRKISTDFVRELTTDRVMELILAADFLHVDLLLEVLNQTVADRIKNKSVEHVRKLFGVESDYTPEEEQKLREEYAWAFEGVDED